MEERAHRRTGETGQLVRRREAPRWALEKGHEHAVAAAALLVRREPQDAAALEVLQRGAQLVAREHRAGVAKAAGLHRPLHRRIAMRAVHPGHGDVPAEQARTEFEVHEMRRDQQHAAALRAQRLEMLEAFDRVARRVVGHAAPPCAQEFEQAEARLREVFARQRLARGRIEAGKAQGEVGLDHASARRQEMPQHGAERAARAALEPRRRACRAPSQRDAQPRAPMARMGEAGRPGCRRCRRGLAHARIVSAPLLPFPACP